jgi:hypothetical protein
LKTGVFWQFFIYQIYDYQGHDSKHYQSHDFDAPTNEQLRGHRAGSAQMRLANFEERFMDQGLHFSTAYSQNMTDGAAGFNV